MSQEPFEDSLRLILEDKDEKARENVLIPPIPPPKPGCVPVPKKKKKKKKKKSVVVEPLPQNEENGKNSLSDLPDGNPTAREMRKQYPDLGGDEFWEKYEADLSTVTTTGSISSLLNAKLWSKLDTPRRKNISISSIAKESDIFMHLYTPGSPDTLWYCHSLGTTVLGIRRSSKYVAFLKATCSYRGQSCFKKELPEGKKDPQILWYGLLTMNGVRPCHYDRSTKSISFSISSDCERTAPTKSPRRAFAEPYELPPMYIAREGGLHTCSVSEAGRKLVGTPNASVAKTEKEWKHALLGVDTVLLQTENYYCIPKGCIDIHNMLTPSEHIIPDIL